MITHESICEKLGFDFMTYKADPKYGKYTEYDGAENPFDILSIEELDFVMSCAKTY